jgi:hypothetical protein
MLRVIAREPTGAPHDQTAVGDPGDDGGLGRLQQRWAVDEDDVVLEACLIEHEPDVGRLEQARRIAEASIAREHSEAPACRARAVERDPSGRVPEVKPAAQHVEQARARRAGEVAM